MRHAIRRSALALIRPSPAYAVDRGKWCVANPSLVLMRLIREACLGCPYDGSAEDAAPASVGPSSRPQISAIRALSRIETAPGCKTKALGLSHRTTWHHRHRSERSRATHPTVPLIPHRGWSGPGAAWRVAWERFARLRANYRLANAQQVLSNHCIGPLCCSERFPAYKLGNAQVLIAVSTARISSGGIDLENQMRLPRRRGMISRVMTIWCSRSGSPEHISGRTGTSCLWISPPTWSKRPAGLSAGWPER